jgi:hypothetical protein
LDSLKNTATKFQAILHVDEKPVKVSLSLYPEGDPAVIVTSPNSEFAAIMKEAGDGHSYRISNCYPTLDEKDRCKLERELNSIITGKKNSISCCQ